MSRLLYANFARLRRSKSLWIGVAVMLLFSVGLCLSEYRSNQTQYGYETSLDAVFFSPYILVGVLIAVFCSVFVGTEYSDGTIRNKLVVGHSRRSIYLANFVSCAAAGLLMVLGYLVAACALGIPLLGPLKTNNQTALLLFLDGILLTVASAAIFCLLSMLNSNRAFAAIISIVVAFAAIFLSAYLHGRLNEPEFRTSYTVTVNEAGEAVVEYSDEPIRNPGYLNESQRALFQFLMDFLPTAQAGQIASRKAPRLGLMPLCSAIIIVVTNAAGMFFFKLKDLK